MDKPTVSGEQGWDRRTEEHDGLGLDTPVWRLNLSAKEDNALEVLGIRTAKEFLELDVSVVMDLCGYGATTYQRLKQSQTALKNGMLGPAVSDEGPEITLQSDVSKLGLNVRARKALKQLKINTVAEFLRLDRISLGRVHNCGEITRRHLSAEQKRVRLLLGEVEVESNDIQGLGLNSRGQTTLKRLGVRTVAEFLQLDLAILAHVCGCGEGTRRHLIRVQKKAQSLLSGSESIGEHSLADRARRCREAAGSPVVEGAWLTLPLFSGTSANGLRVADLHGSYNPDFSVESLRFPKRCRQALAARGIISLGELLLTSGPELVRPHMVGSQTLAMIQSFVEDFLRYSFSCHSLDGYPSIQVDTSSPESFLLSLVDPVIIEERQKRVLLARLGGHSDPKTLDEIAVEYGLTRARIWQLEKAALWKLFDWRAIHALRPLHDFIVRLLQTASPLISLRYVGKRLQREHGWDRPIHSEAIRKLLPAFRDLRCVERRYLRLTSFRCPECAVLPKVVEAALCESAVNRLGVRVLAEDVLRQMCVSGVCAQCSERSGHTSTNLVRVAFKHSASLKAKYRLVKDEVWHIDEYRLARGHLSPALERVLRQHSQPMSYRQVHTEVNRTRQHQVSAEVVWHALNSCAKNGTDILLWNRGGVYLHKSHVNLYLPILNAIEKWVIRELEDGVVPQLSAHAAFRVFPEECAASGITSAYAIHSCLKHRQHPKLVFFRSPYIGLAGASWHRIPNVEIAEELIRQEGDIMPLDCLRDVLCMCMGLKDFQFNQIIYQLDNVVRAENGFLHADYFDSENHTFQALVEHVQERLARDAHLSVELIYNERRIPCLQLGIDGPRMLHSVLSLFAGDAIAVRSYPLLERPSANEATARATIRDKVAGFIRTKGRPVSCEELRKEFVSRLGFSHSTVMAAASTDPAIRYLNGIVVHCDTIEWSPAKQCELVRKAKEYYAEQVSAGDWFATVDHLLELHETELPTLESGVAWTAVLLAELLERDTGIGVFGNRQNAFVLRADGDRMHTFADFVHMVVEKRFQGACGLTELSEFLRNSGVIAKAVTPKMLEGADNLVVGTYDVAVK